MQSLSSCPDPRPPRLRHIPPPLFLDPDRIRILRETDLAATALPGVEVTTQLTTVTILLLDVTIIVIIVIAIIVITIIAIIAIIAIIIAITTKILVAILLLLVVPTLQKPPYSIPAVYLGS